MTYKLLAIDLDDTLLRDDNTISSYTKEVLREAQKKGVQIVIATGRMFQTAYPVGHALGLGDVPMILYSGGVIQRVESKEILFEQPISVETATRILDIAKSEGFYVQSYIDDKLLIEKENDFSQLYERATGAKAVYVGDDLYRPHKGTNKLLLVEHPHKMQRAVDILSWEMKDTVELVRSKVNFLEIVAPHVSKGKALQYLGNMYGISLEEMVSFGNSENDVPMLQMTGHSVAVMNGEEAVKAIAKEICQSNEDDGVARWIEANIL